VPGQVVMCLPQGNVLLLLCYLLGGLGAEDRVIIWIEVDPVPWTAGPRTQKMEGFSQHVYESGDLLGPAEQLQGIPRAVLDADHEIGCSLGGSERRTPVR
jgi:hypothetical protein